MDITTSKTDPSLLLELRAGDPVAQWPWHLQPLFCQMLLKAVFSTFEHTFHKIEYTHNRRSLTVEG